MISNNGTIVSLLLGYEWPLWAQPELAGGVSTCMPALVARYAKRAEALFAEWHMCYYTKVCPREEGMMQLDRYLEKLGLQLSLASIAKLQL